MLNLLQDRTVITSIKSGTYSHRLDPLTSLTVRMVYVTCNTAASRRKKAGACIHILSSMSLLSLQDIDVDGTTMNMSAFSAELIFLPLLSTHNLVSPTTTSTKNSVD